MKFINMQNDKEEIEQKWPQSHLIYKENFPENLREEISEEIESLGISISLNNAKVPRCPSYLYVSTQASMEKYKIPIPYPIMFGRDPDILNHTTIIQRALKRIALNSK